MGSGTRRRNAATSLASRIRRALGRTHELDRRDRLDLLETLSDSGCAPCRAREDAVRRWFWTYRNDTAGDLTMRLMMERSLGLCPAHTRRLLGLGAPSSWLATGLFADVTHAGLRAIAAGTRETEPCPPCRIGDDAADVLLSRLTGALDRPAEEPDVALYFGESDGLCRAHAARALRASGRTTAAAVLGRFTAQLDRDPPTILVTLCGYDPDVVRRAAMHRRGSSHGSGRAEPGADGCCPICADRLRAEWAALDEAGDGAPDRAMCAGHLAVLAADGLTEAVTGTIDATAALYRADTARRPVQRRSVRAGVRREPPCAVCAAGSAAAAHARAALGDVPGDGRIEPGVCLRHGLAADLTEPRRQALAARLRELAAELDAARRAYAGPGEAVVSRSDATAWQRAPAVLDGAVLGPAGVLPAS